MNTSNELDTSTKSSRILLADDHTLVRAGIRALLEKLPGIKVAGEASDGREVLGLIKEKQPDVVLMDISMPGLNGLEALAHITREFPHVRVIILSMHHNDEYVLQAFKSGACGYLLKRAAPPNCHRPSKRWLAAKSTLAEKFPASSSRNFPCNKLPTPAARSTS